MSNLVEWPETMRELAEDHGFRVLKETCDFACDDYHVNLYLVDASVNENVSCKDERVVDIHFAEYEEDRTKGCL